MARYPIRKLKIDENFRNLKRPLFPQEYKKLEENLIANGCIDPIITWNGYIIDGHNRYEICMRHGIPYRSEEMDFDYREEVIAWICAKQLKRRNLTDETRKFLIGMQYESEKIVNAKRTAAEKKKLSLRDSNSSWTDLSNRKTAHRIANENHISYGSVEKYAHYTRALEEIGKKEPRLVPKILSGKYKISHNALISLSKLPTREIIGINDRLERSAAPAFMPYHVTRKEITDTVKSASAEPPVTETREVHSIKDMPAYDPDSEITGLTLTIPSWGSSITRVMNVSDMKAVSVDARWNLMSALCQLQSVIDDMLIALKEA